MFEAKQHNRLKLQDTSSFPSCQTLLRPHLLIQSLILLPVIPELQKETLTCPCDFIH